MISRPTVFVLGAGASVEAGFPSGAQLISGMISEIENLLHELGSAGSVYINERAVQTVTLRRIRDGLKHNQSIDNYLSSVPDDKEIQLIGKYLIAKHILVAEQNSHCAYDHGQRGMRHEAGMLSSWYEQLFRRMRERTTDKNIENMFDNVAFVNFNYDRSLPQYFTQALAACYPDCDNIDDIVRENMEIIHPYGRIGALEYENDPQSLVRYGCQYENPFKVASSIYTFEEDTSPLSGHHQKIQHYFSMAERIVFLGFAFHQQNIELLFPDLDAFRNCNDILFTSMGISNGDMSALRRVLLHRVNPNAEIHQSPCTCVEFFNQFRITLAN